MPQTPSSLSTFNLTEGAHPRPRPAKQVAAIVGCGQDQPEHGYVPECSPHSFFRVWKRGMVTIRAPPHLALPYEAENGNEAWHVPHYLTSCGVPVRVHHSAYNPNSPKSTGEALRQAHTSTGLHKKEYTFLSFFSLHLIELAANFVR